MKRNKCLSGNYSLAKIMIQDRTDPQAMCYCHLAVLSIYCNEIDENETINTCLIANLIYSTLASYPGLLRRRDKAWYPLFAHARVAVEFHRRRLSSYTFAVRDEYSSVFVAVREALLFAIYSDDCIVSSFLEALTQ